MPEYIYLNHQIPVEMVGCTEDVRNMHKDTRRVLISETISDFINEIFFLGNIIKYLAPWKIKKKNYRPNHTWTMYGKRFIIDWVET